MSSVNSGGRKEAPALNDCEMMDLIARVMTEQNQRFREREDMLAMAGSRHETASYSGLDGKRRS